VAFQRDITRLGSLSLLVLACALGLTLNGPKRPATALQGPAARASGSEAQEIDAGNCPDEAVSPAASQSDARLSAVAMRPTHTVPRGRELTRSTVSALPVPQTGLPTSQLRCGTAEPGGLRPIPSALSLQVLFCAWLK
jgi:hypothetical protein